MGLWLDRGRECDNLHQAIEIQIIHYLCGTDSPVSVALNTPLDRPIDRALRGFFIRFCYPSVTRPPKWRLLVTNKPIYHSELQPILDLVEEILSEDKDAKIAVLSKFRPTVRQIQKQFILQSKKSEIPENVKIETVDRVQGLTVDYCIFFIPNASLKYSLEKELFNVATSRAKYCTIIVADKSLMGKDMEEEVRKYLLKSQDDKFVAFNSTKNITAGNVSVNVLGKIDLSKFEKKRKEIVEGKENIYIIDTNVFVNCPNIIDRIGHKYKVIIPAKVLEELDKLKLKNNIDKNALNTAARNINLAFTKQFSKMEDADISLLPVGFDKNNPDCQILSVALKYKGENPIILTSDNILQTRAKGLGITTISLTDFLRQLR